MKLTRLPGRSCQVIALDLLGLMPRGEHLVVLIDYHSRWMKVDVVQSTSIEKIIKCLEVPLPDMEKLNLFDKRWLQSGVS